MVQHVQKDGTTSVRTVAEQRGIDKCKFLLLLEGLARGNSVKEIHPTSQLIGRIIPGRYHRSIHESEENCCLHT